MRIRKGLIVEVEKAKERWNCMTKAGKLKMRRYTIPIDDLFLTIYCADVMMPQSTVRSALSAIRAQSRLLLNNTHIMACILGQILRQETRQKYSCSCHCHFHVLLPPWRTRSSSHYTAHLRRRQVIFYTKSEKDILSSLIYIRQFFRRPSLLQYKLKLAIETT